MNIKDSVIPILCVFCGFERDSDPWPLLLLCGLYSLRYPLHLFFADIIRTTKTMNFEMTIIEIHCRYWTVGSQVHFHESVGVLWLNGRILYSYVCEA
jgi:hypothetical protein